MPEGEPAPGAWHPASRLLSALLLFEVAAHPKPLSFSSPSACTHNAWTDALTYPWCCLCSGGRAADRAGEVDGPGALGAHERSPVGKTALASAVPPPS